MNGDIKPGIKTSELWFKVIMSIIAALLAFQVLTNDQANSLVQVVVAIMPLLPAIMYGINRTKLKQNGN